MPSLTQISKVSPQQVPYISFAARGTLLHENPSFEKSCFSYLRNRGVEVSESEVKRSLIRELAKLNEMPPEEVQACGTDYFYRSLIRSYLPETADANIEEELGRWESFHRGSMKLVIPQLTVDVCESLRERGYRLCINTNEDSRLIEVLKMLNLLELFDAVLLGQEVGALKPDPASFQSLLEDLGITVDQIIHVGDRYCTDVRGAQAVGMASILYDPLQYEVMALNRLEDFSAEKVVSIEDLRKNRLISGVKVISRFEELLDFFK